MCLKSNSYSPKCITKSPTNPKKPNGKTPLDFAAQNCHLEKNEWLQIDI